VRNTHHREQEGGVYPPQGAGRRCIPTIVTTVRNTHQCDNSEEYPPWEHSRREIPPWEHSRREIPTCVYKGERYPPVCTRARDTHHGSIAGSVTHHGSIAGSVTHLCAEQ